MPKALTMADLGSQQCDAPGCTHSHAGPLYLSPKCHRGAATYVCYRDGEMVVECADCGLTVAVVKVANA